MKEVFTISYEKFLRLSPDGVLKLFRAESLSTFCEMSNEVDKLFSERMILWEEEVEENTKSLKEVIHKRILKNQIAAAAHLFKREVAYRYYKELGEELRKREKMPKLTDRITDDVIGFIAEEVHRIYDSICIGTDEVYFPKMKIGVKDEVKTSDIGLVLRADIIIDFGVGLSESDVKEFPLYDDDYEAQWREYALVEVRKLRKTFVRKIKDYSLRYGGVFRRVDLRVLNETPKSELPTPGSRD